jgi:hypothetical protein
LNDSGFFEEASKLTGQLEKLFPEETFGQDFKFVKNEKSGKTEAVQLGNKGTIRTAPGYTQPVSADTIYNANKPQITETDNGFVRINPMNGKVQPVVGSNGKMLPGKGQILDTENGVVRIQGGNATPVLMNNQPLAGKSKDATEDQAKAAGFFSRMQDASKVLNNPDFAKSVKPEKLAEIPRTILPDFLGAQAIGNSIESAPRQQVRQAQENWVSANLRAESGAAIGVDEMRKEIVKYFPQIGDSNEVIQQKQRARSVAEDSMRTRAGRALKSSAPLPPGGAAPQSLFPSPTSTLGNLYNNYGLTPSRGN